MLRSGLLMMVMCVSVGSSAFANAPPKTQKVIYPNGRVVYEPIKAKAASNEVKPEPPVVDAPQPPETTAVAIVQQPTPADANAPCSPCGPTTPDHPQGDCKKDNPVVIVPGSDHDCEGDKKCYPKDNPQHGSLSSIPGGLVKFYKECKEFRGTTDIPVIVKNQREDLIFGRHKYGEKCCEYIVCVVKECCCIDTRNCELRPKKVSMKACLRYDGSTVDVYVLNEPGFPAEWVLHMGLTLAEYRSKFPGGPTLP